MDTTSAAPRTAGRGERATHYVTQFHDLTTLVREAGLMGRSYGFYAWSLGLAAAAAASIWVGVVLLGDSWLQLLLAAGLGVVAAQLGFLGHEACHRQVFTSGRRNEWAGRVLSGLCVGISYGWWMTKHTRHHANPNRVDKDPDIRSGAVAFSDEAADQRTGLAARVMRWQGVFFLPLLALEGLSLHVSSIRYVLGSEPVKNRGVEIAFLAARLLGFPALAFWLLPPGMAVAFIGVQVVVFGFLLGGAFAPNHIGMPVVPRDMKLDFLRRQVLMSRNIAGGPVVRFLMGGLDTQVEHHLFPGMARPNLRRAQHIVRAYCAEHQITYTETTLTESYVVILRYLNQVGTRQRDLFACPLAQQIRN